MKPYYESDDILLYHCSATELLMYLQCFAPRCIDLILTDPPYTKAVQDNAKRGYRNETKAFINFDSISESDLITTFNMFSKVANGWVISFLADDHTYLFKRQPPAGLDFVRAGVFSKPNTAPHVNQDRPSQGWESIAMLHQADHQGKYLWNSAGRRNHSVFEYPFCNQGLNKTQKPLGLITELIELFSNVDDTVLDCFAGSGTTLLAARNTGRKAIDCEISEQQCDVVARRLNTPYTPAMTIDK